MFVAQRLLSKYVVEGLRQKNIPQKGVKKGGDVQSNGQGYTQVKSKDKGKKPSWPKELESYYARSK